MNNKAQFTPGPWQVNDSTENDDDTTLTIFAPADEVEIATMSAYENGCECFSEIRENAHLIAAAPAMYDRHKDNHGMVQEALRYLYEGEYEEVKCLLNHIALNSKHAVRQAEGR